MPEGARGRGQAKGAPLAWVKAWRQAWRRAAVLLLALNLATDIGLFQVHGRSFPFVQYWNTFHTKGPSLERLFAPPDILL